MYFNKTTYANFIKVNLIQKKAFVKTYKPLKYFQYRVEGYFIRNCKKKPKISWKLILELRKVGIVEIVEDSYNLFFLNSVL